MATYTLFWHPRVSSLAPQAVLEEVSVDYDMRRIDVESREQKSEAYLRINPNGLLPALLLEDGSPIFESAGIVMYLADHYPEAGWPRAFLSVIGPVIIIRTNREGAAVWALPFE